MSYNISAVVTSIRTRILALHRTYDHAGSCRSNMRSRPLTPGRRLSASKVSTISSICSSIVLMIHLHLTGDRGVYLNSTLGYLVNTHCTARNHYIPTATNGIVIATEKKASSILSAQNLTSHAPQRILPHRVEANEKTESGRVGVYHGRGCRTTPHMRPAERQDRSFTCGQRLVSGIDTVLQDACDSPPARLQQAPCRGRARSGTPPRAGQHQPGNGRRGRLRRRNPSSPGHGPGRAPAP